MKTKFLNAVKTVTNEIKNDAELKQSYKSNIAMAFKDEYDRAKSKKNYLNQNDIRKISNDAAEYFLNLWCK